MKNLKYLVTGTGRCGTVYSARLLTSLGIPCGHESIFDWHGYDWAVAKLKGQIEIQTSEVSTFKLNDQGVCEVIPEWFDEKKIVAESSYMAAPFLRDKIFKNTKFIHIVRHPVQVVNSFINYLSYFENRHPSLWSPAKRYETFIFSHCSDLFYDMSQAERAMTYFLRWNQMIMDKLDGKNFFFYRVEDPVDSLVDFLDVKNLPENLFADRKINSFEKQCCSFTLDMLPSGFLKDEFIDMGVRFGYDMSLAKTFI